jgi:hypothetical protein
MRPSLIKTLCPYTLKPIAEIPNIDREHIIPEAIGGSMEYSVKVDAKVREIAIRRWLESGEPLADRITDLTCL